MPELVKLVPAMNFIDHGNTVEPGDPSYRLYTMAVGSAGQRMMVKAGDRLMLGEVELPSWPRTAR